MLVSARRVVIDFQRVQTDPWPVIDILFPYHAATYRACIHGEDGRTGADHFHSCDTSIRTAGADLCPTLTSRPLTPDPHHTMAAGCSDADLCLSNTCRRQSIPIPTAIPIFGGFVFQRQMTSVDPWDENEFVMQQQQQR